MEGKDVCQSCGLPFDQHRPHAIDAHGNASADYCNQCMENGIFCANDSMFEMIERTLPQMMAANLGLTEDKAREVMSKELFPNLKRWQDAFEE